MSKERRQRRKQRKAAKKGGKAEPDAATKAGPDVRIDPVHNKWLAFGGGFYGIVGLLTYAVVEFGELRDFSWVSRAWQHCWPSSDSTC